MQLSFTDQLCLLWGEYFGGLHFLTFIFHEALLVFFILWKLLVYIIHRYRWPGQLVPIADALDPRGFVWEPRCRMEVSDYALYTW